MGPRERMIKFLKDKCQNPIFRRDELIDSTAPQGPVLHVLQNWEADPTM